MYSVWNRQGVNIVYLLKYIESERVDEPKRFRGVGYGAAGDAVEQEPEGPVDFYRDAAACPSALDHSIAGEVDGEAHDPE